MYVIPLRRFEQTVTIDASVLLCGKKVMFTQINITVKLLFIIGRLFASAFDDSPCIIS